MIMSCKLGMSINEAILYILGMSMEKRFLQMPTQDLVRCIREDLDVPAKGLYLEDDEFVACGVYSLSKMLGDTSCEALMSIGEKTSVNEINIIASKFQEDFKGKMVGEVKVMLG